MSALAAERADLLARLRAEAALRGDRGVSSAPDQALARRRMAPDLPDMPSVGSGSAARWLATAGPQTLLAASGVLLLAIAAVVFAAVAWRDLSTVARGGALLLASTASGLLTRRLVGRGLRRSAEATGVLTVAVSAVLLDGLWRAGLLGWTGGDAAAVAVSAAVLAAAAHALARGTAVRSPLVLTAWLAAVAMVATGQALADRVSRLDLPALAASAAAAGLLGGAVVGAAYAERHLHDLSAWREGTRVAAAVLWLVAVLGAVIVVAAPAPLHAAAPALALLTLGGAVVSADLARRMGATGRRWDAAGFAGMWFAATIGAGAALADRVAPWPEAAVVVPLALGASALWLPAEGAARRWAAYGMIPATLAALTPVLAVVGWLGSVIAARLDAPWTGQAQAGMVAATAPGVLTLLSALTVVALVMVVAHRIGSATLATPYAATAGVLLAVAAGVRASPVTGGAAIGVVVVALAAVMVRATVHARRAAGVLVGASVMATVTSLSTPAVTIATLAAMATVTSPACRRPVRRPGRVAAGVVTADLMALAAAVAAATTDGPGPVAVAVAAAALCAWGVAARPRAHPARGSAVEAIAAAAFGTAIGAAAPAPAPWSAVVYALLAVATAGVAVWRADRRWLQWVATAAATAASSTLLADLGVRLVEAYTMPPALVIVVLAALGLRARPAASSWPVLGTGLTLLTLPTTWQLVADPADLRRLTASIALGSALVVAGRVRALQSPLVIGAGVLALAALSQHDVITDVLPRWLLLAAAGTLLLWLSVGYERQRTRVSEATRRLAAMR